MIGHLPALKEFVAEREKMAHVEVLKAYLTDLFCDEHCPDDPLYAALTAAIAALDAVRKAEVITIGYSATEDVMHRTVDDWILEFKDRDASKGDPADGDYYLIPADAVGGGE